MDWKTFKEMPEWQEIVTTVKDRLILIKNDLADPNETPDIATVRALQKEQLTCLWFISLPEIILAELKEDKKREHNEDS